LEENSRMTARAKVKHNAAAQTAESRMEHLRADRTLLAESLLNNRGLGCRVFLDVLRPAKEYSWTASRSVAIE
jgi:hypothetical protein